jgi:hypothetical protein
MKYSMKPKVRELADKLVAAISQWDSVECICLNEAATTDTLDPYFALILDVYIRGSVPSSAVRASSYPSHTVFETSPTGTKDRFLVGELPVRIEYKHIDRIEELTNIALRAGSDLWKLRDSGTYVFYRVVHCQPLFQRTEWLSEITAKLSNLTDPFWVQMRSFYQSSMDHFLADLGASIVQNDHFFYMVSATSFIRYACSALFMENGLFEPSHRGFLSQVGELKTLPDDFAGRFESFLRPDSELPPQRKYEIAKLIARSIVSL